MDFLHLAGLRGGGQSTLVIPATPAGTTHAQVAEQTGAALTRQLAPADANHAQTATTTTAALTRQLTPANTAHAQVAEQTGASLTKLAVPGACTHVQSSGEPAATVDKVAFPTDAAHPHTAYETDLDALLSRTTNFIWIAGLQGGGLTTIALPDYATDNATHVVTVGSPAVNLSLSLAPTAVTGEQTVQGVGGVSLDAGCSPTDAAHAVAAGVPAVELDALAVPADATHAHRASTLHVDIGATVSPQEADHNHAAQVTTVQLQSLAAPADTVHEQLTSSTVAALTPAGAVDDVAHVQTVEGSDTVVTVGALPADVTHTQVVGTSGVATNPIDVVEVELRLVASSIWWHVEVADNDVHIRAAEDGVHLISLTPADDTRMLPDTPVFAATVSNRAIAVINSSLLASSVVPVGDRLPVLRACDDRSRMLTIGSAGAASLHGVSAASTALSLAQN